MINEILACPESWSLDIWACSQSISNGPSGFRWWQEAQEMPHLPSEQGSKASNTCTRNTWTGSTHIVLIMRRVMKKWDYLQKLWNIYSEYWYYLYKNPWLFRGNENICIKLIKSVESKYSLKCWYRVYTYIYTHILQMFLFYLWIHRQTIIMDFNVFAQNIQFVIQLKHTNKHVFLFISHQDCR